MCQYSYTTAPVLLPSLALRNNFALGIQPTLQEEEKLLSLEGEAHGITYSRTGTGTRGQTEAY